MECVRLLSMEIFDFENYREYLLWRVGGEGSRTGIRQQIAKALRIHSTFVSHVLSGKADFSAEQIEDINEFFGHTVLEADYLHLLVSHARAGSQKLKLRFEKQIKALLVSQKAIGKQLQADQVSEEQARKYYSKILYSLVHMGAPLSKYSPDLQQLAIATQSTPTEVREAIEFLLASGLLNKQQKGHLTEFRLGQQHVHISRDSAWFKDNHSNYRMFAIQQFTRSLDTDLHFSSAFSATQEDFEKIKDLQKKVLKKQVEVIKAAKEEELFIFNFDLMQLKP